MARFSDDDRFAFLLGAWVPCTSSCVSEARYVEETETLEIVFVGNSWRVYEYPNVPFSLAEGFAFSPSKGQWLWQALWRTGRSYATSSYKRTPPKKKKGYGGGAAGS